jgi:cytochrome c oxidase subunit 1
MGFTGASLSFDYAGTAYMMMAVSGVGGVLAAVGGAMFIVVTVGSLIFGKKLEPSAGFLQSFALAPLAPEVYNIDQPAVLELAEKLPVEEHGSGGFHAPGTFVLAMILMACFVVYYFINWDYLS